MTPPDVTSIDWDEALPGMGGYAVAPAVRDRPLPALVIGMSLLGINAELREAADYLAGLGYLVYAPNLFYRQAGVHAFEEDIPLEKGLAVSLSYLGKTEDSASVAVFAEIAAKLRSAPACDGRIGTVGWCYGGRIAYLAATSRAADAAACLYPTWIETVVGQHRAPTPTCIHMAEHEPYAKLDRPFQRVRDALASDPAAEVHLYAGASHGFDFRRSRVYHPLASKLANGRTAAFLERRLRGVRMTSPGPHAGPCDGVPSFVVGDDSA